VNNQGRIQAQTVQGHGGTIDLLGGESGTVTVGGTLDASAAAGDGGAIETSGAHVTVADGAVITEKSHGGKDGRWLIDPQDFTIAASGGDISGATLSANLGNGDVTIQSSEGGTSGAGDILVNDRVSWSVHTLTLHADRNIVVNATMNGSDTAGLFLAYGQSTSSGSSSGVVATYLVHAPINLASTGSFATQLGSAGTKIDYTILSSLGTSGSITGTDLQGINGGLAGHYVLGSDIDASETATWNSGAGFAPLGSSTTAFTGIFDGLGHTITGLTINRPSTDDVGLFGVLKGVVRNVGLVDGSITGKGLVGALAGENLGGGSISHAYATSSVAGSNNVGGLVGNNTGVIANVYATGSVNGTGNDIGGLIGENTGGVGSAYAIGSVTSITGNNVGGLVGLNNTNGFIKDSYAAGAVIGANQVGGLVGQFFDGQVSRAYASGSVNGTSQIGGLVGQSFGGEIDNAYATGGVAGTGNNIGGLVGNNTSNASISNAYATGLVSGASASTGGLVGKNSKGGSVANGYWDTTTTGQDTDHGFGSNQATVTGGGGLSTAQLAASLPEGFDASIWDNIGDRTTPYLLSHASFDTVSGSVLRGSDASATPAVFNVILTVDQLQSIERVGLAANYVLGTNIDASATAYWNDGAGFDPLGDSSQSFIGIFDGLNHTITGLTIERPDTDDVGLFARIGRFGKVLNVGLEGGSVRGGRFVGALAGSSFNGIIKNAHVTGDVSGTSAIGGLLGFNHGGNVFNDYATGNVTGDISVGGLVGSNVSAGAIDDAYATGSVTGSSNVGGLVGSNAGFGFITDSYATGRVSGTNNVGGLVGANSDDSNGNGGEINNAFATGRVSGSVNVGGFIGQNDAFSTIVHGYWDTETTGQSAGVGSGTNANTDVHGLTTAQMQQQSSFVGFDFDTPVWVIYDGHTAPLLRSFLTDLTVTADDQSQVYAGQSAHFGLSNAHFSIDGADTSGHLFGLDDPYDGAVNVGSYTPDLWSDQQGFFVTIVGGALTITPKSLTLAGLTVNNKTYDGSAGAVIGSLGTLSGIVGNDQVQLGGGSAAFADANAGVGKEVSISGLGLLGAAAGNYVLVDGTGATTTVASATADITPKTLTFAGLSVGDKVYDGSTTATLGNLGTLSGIVGDDDVSLSGTGADIAFADANAGTNKTVNIGGLSLSGAAADNYVLASTAATTASITARTLTLADLGVDNKVYDGSTAATIGNLGTLSGIVGDDDVSLSDAEASASFADANVGTHKTVSVSGLGLSGAAAGNYVLASTITSTADITPKTLTFAGLGIDDKVYDGNTAATIGSFGTLSGVVGNDQVSLSGAEASASFADANAGNAKAVHVTGLGLSGAASGNYVLSSTQADATADIARRVLTVAGLAVNNKEYDGTTAATLGDVNALRLAGVVSGDDVGLDDEGLHVAFADANAGTNKAVTVSGLVLSGDSAGNYELGASPTTASILRRVLTVSGVTVNGKVYDGNTAATLAGAGGFGDRVVGGDDVQLDLEAALAAFADANAGNGKTVHVSGLGLSGADAANYELASTDANATADIARRALTVSVVGNPTKTFDGSTDVSLDASNFRLDGFVAGEGARVTPTTGRYASADVGTGIAVSASLDAGDFAANAGTLLGNYLLPEVATGLGSIVDRAQGIDPALADAVASATRNTVWGYAGLDSFALPLDPRWQIRVQAHGPRQPVHLTMHGGVLQPQRAGCSDQVDLDPFITPTVDHCDRN